jgi:hypothetical protein
MISRMSFALNEAILVVAFPVDIKLTSLAMLGIGILYSRQYIKVSA